MTFLIQIDGCIFKKGTYELCPGVKETLKMLDSQGHVIILLSNKTYYCDTVNNLIAHEIIYNSVVSHCGTDGEAICLVGTSSENDVPNVLSVSCPVDAGISSLKKFGV